jgi:sensor histidine kinase YesM
MYSVDTKKYFIGLQVLLWLIYYLVMIAYGGNKWNSYSYATWVASISIFFYLFIVYANSLWLLPRFYKNGKKRIYVISIIIFLIACNLLRLWLENEILFPKQNVFYNYNWPHLFLVFITNLIAFLFGTLLHIAQNYIALLKKQTAIESQQLVTELNLLKQQVQPHFLFNTLNNIYSLANAKSDNTKVAIAKLADMMRYFTEDAPKEKIALQKEITFIENYIALEQLRMLHPVKFNIDFTKENIELPTMLLMPFVENVFKHGIDKTKEDNTASLTLTMHNNKLQFSVSNKIAELHKEKGFGLDNLKKRLALLYDSNYVLTTTINNNIFEAFMEIPIV